ncbi:MAG: PP2C family protein-serine/threonine phosphatase, partial [Chloroflexota bacterium]
MIERPQGGLSLVLADGQRSGKAAKAISNVVARKTVQLLGEGVRDGAAARAAHDYLYTYRGGKVSCTLNIVSVDMVSRTLVISRNNPAPVIVHTAERGFYLLDEPAEAVGVHRNTKPVITEVPIEVGTLIVSFSDGLQHAGSLSGDHRLNLIETIYKLLTAGANHPQAIADGLLVEALQLEHGRPHDDISIVVLMVVEGQGQQVRRLSVQVPL